MRATIEYLAHLLGCTLVEMRSPGEPDPREELIGRVAEDLERIAAAGDTPYRQRIADAVDALRGVQGDPGSPYDTPDPQDVTFDRLMAQRDEARVSSAQAANDRLRDQIQNLNAAHDSTIRFIANRLADMLDADQTDIHTLLALTEQRLDRTEGGA
jgi:hypothetical protein